MSTRPHFLVAAFLLCSTAFAQNAKQFVQHAVNTELAADQADHSQWIFCESDHEPGKTVLRWVAETQSGNINRVLQRNGSHIPLAQQQQAVMAFVRSPGAQAKQRQSDQHDDAEATAMLKMLPNAFAWTIVDRSPAGTTLQFKPDPHFQPPAREARVFAAMSGKMVVSPQNRIQDLQGRMIHDVRFGWGGVLGRLNAGGTFQVQRRDTGDGVWQITQTHVHIHGHALFFKTISEEEDDVKSQFKRLPDGMKLQQAAREVMSQPDSVHEGAAPEN